MKHRALLLLCAAAALAQDPFLARRDAILRAQPAGVDLKIAAPKTRFYLGEIVPLTLSFTARERGAFVAESRLSDRVGRLNGVDEFVADPVAMTEDPLSGFLNGISGMGGISSGPAILEPDKPFNVERQLNEWVRFRQPGTYRIYVISRRAQQVTERGLSDEELRFYHRGQPVRIVSNVLTIEVAAAPPAWVAEQISESVAILKAPPTNDSASQQARTLAARALRYLDTVEAAVALAAGMDTADPFSARMAVLASHHRVELLPRLQTLLAAPEQRIDSAFLNTLAELQVLVEAGGPMPPYPEAEAERRKWADESRRRQEALLRNRAAFAETLLRSLAAKRPEVRPAIHEALLIEARSLEPRPAWTAGVAASLAADYLSLPPAMQNGLLEGQWSLLRATNILPALIERFTDTSRPLAGPFGELLLRRIYEIDPERGRELILTELRRPMGPRAGGRSLLILPDENLPELDEVFAAHAAGGGPLRAELIARYAGGNVVEQVKAAYVAHNRELDRQKLPRCPFPLAFYFLKHDPEFGERELRNVFANGPCYDLARALDALGAHGWSPALERLAMEFVNSGAPVAVKRGAAEALGKYGSPAVQERLWETMEYFRGWWKDQADLLANPEGREGQMLEQALVSALGQANAWVLDRAQLQRLLALCTGGSCRGSVQGYLSMAAGTAHVSISQFPTGVRIGIAQYQVGEDELAAKLAQFPAGTQFQVPRGPDEETQRVQARVEAAIRAAGHRIVPQPNR